MMESAIEEAIERASDTDAVQVQCCLTYLGIQIASGGPDALKTLENPKVNMARRAMWDPLQRLRVLAESRGMDSTPLWELCTCDSQAQIDAVEPLLERLDLIEQMMQGKVDGVDKSVAEIVGECQKATADSVHHFDGLTRKELVVQAEELIGSFSPDTLRRIREKAGVKARPAGGAGPQSRYSIVEIKKLVETASNSDKPKWKQAGAAWAQCIKD